MTKRMIKFPSISQFRNVVQTVTNRAQYVGKDVDGNAVYDTTKPLPILPFTGTCKLHGTNAAIAKHGDDMWCQSRQNIITIESDNAGFATWAHGHTALFDLIFDELKVQAQPGPDDTLMIFGEWCGGSIQKSVGLNQLPKMFVIFKAAVVSPEEQIPNGPDNFQMHSEKRWIDPLVIKNVLDYVQTSNAVYPESLKFIYDFDTYLINIDFARPHDAQGPLVQMTQAVENECPVAKALGAVANDKGMIVGEGIVWCCLDPAYQDSGYWFKVKGDEHSLKTKVKTLAAADVQRIDTINELADTFCPQWRLEQMYQQTFDTLNGGKGDIKRTGEFIKAVMADICKEEADVLSASGFTSKEINGRVSKNVRDYLNTQLNAEANLG